MKTFLLIASILGIINSFIVILFSITTQKGEKSTNYLFAALVFALTVRISKSILLTFSDGLHDILLTLGLCGFLAIAPIYMLLIRSITIDNFRLSRKDFLHFIPALLLFLIWFKLDYIRSDYWRWNFVYQLIMIQYMIYTIISIKESRHIPTENRKLKIQINALSSLLILIWVLYYLNAITRFFPYIAGALVYSVIIYFTVSLVTNKGYIFDLVLYKKYEKTGINDVECQNLIDRMNILFDSEKIYCDNTISLAKLAKQLNTSTHQLSKAINLIENKSYYELLANYRIQNAKQLLLDDKEQKIEQVAYEVGYNSISAFNSAFKKITGLTPTQYKNNNE